MSKRRVVWTLVCGLLCADIARAQSEPPRIELGVQAASALSGEFDTADTGFGGRVSWRPHRLFGVEAELNVFPRDFPSGQPFSRGRLEGLFGATAGVTVNRIRPFARVRPGFVVVQEAPEPFACILIFPPPLPCTLATGRTLLAIDVGGGLDITTTSRTFVRVDLGDRLLKYPGPAFDADRSIREHAFFVHEFRVATGAGFRF